MVAVSGGGRPAMNKQWEGTEKGDDKKRMKGVRGGRGGWGGRRQREPFPRHTVLPKGVL